MKLLNYTSKKLSILLLLVIGIWATLFYFKIIDEITDETDDMLESYREIIIKNILENPELLTVKNNNIFDRYKIRPLNNDEVKSYREKWFDIEEHFEIDDENIPMRVFQSAFRASDGRFYELEVKTSTLERDDMIEAILIYMLLLYFGLLLCVMIGNRIILKRSFAPLEKLVTWLKEVTAGKPIPPLDNDTDISEFKELGEAALEMSQRNAKAYESQKQFIENAAHELQTPLSVAMTKLELMTAGESLSETQLSEIDAIQRSLNRAIKLNKSLLLQARIENKQYLEVKNVDIKGLIEKTVSDLSDVFENKKLNLSFNAKGDCNISMNESLAQILVGNLLKNAFAHSPKNGDIDIELNSDLLIIKNTGDRALDTTKIFNRFYRNRDNQNDESSGLGLAIAKSIADNSRFHLTYHYEAAHIFRLKFAK